MIITDELREYIQIAFDNGSAGRARFEAIADRIDREHRMALEKVAAEVDEDAMEEHGWVKLPVDADGVPYRIDDKVDSDHYEDGTVVGIQYFKAPNGVVFEEIAVQPNGWDTATWRDPEEYRHYHVPTVEDVLREFTDEVWNRCCDGATASDSSIDELVAEYAAKLMLKEG